MLSRGETPAELCSPKVVHRSATVYESDRDEVTFVLLFAFRHRSHTGSPVLSIRLSAIDSGRTMAI